MNGLPKQAQLYSGISNSGGAAAKQNGTARRHPWDPSQSRSPARTMPAVYSLASAQPLANPASKSHRCDSNQRPVPLPGCWNPEPPCLAMAQIAMDSSPSTSACENIMVAYGSGAAPRNRARVVTSALRVWTRRHSQPNSAAPPHAVMIPIEPAQAPQLESSHPGSESSPIRASFRSPAASKKGPSANAAVPGALSL